MSIRKGVTVFNFRLPTEMFGLPMMCSSITTGAGPGEGTPLQGLTVCPKEGLKIGGDVPLRVGRAF